MKAETNKTAQDIAKAIGAVVDGGDSQKKIATLIAGASKDLAKKIAKIKKKKADELKKKAKKAAEKEAKKAIKEAAKTALNKGEKPAEPKKEVAKTAKAAAK